MGLTSPACRVVLYCCTGEWERSARAQSVRGEDGTVYKVTLSSQSQTSNWQLHETFRKTNSVNTADFGLLFKWFVFKGWDIEIHAKSAVQWTSDSRQIYKTNETRLFSVSIHLFAFKRYLFVIILLLWSNLVLFRNCTLYSVHLTNSWQFDIGCHLKLLYTQDLLESLIQTVVVTVLPAVFCYFSWRTKKS